jgi:hypothetical protein
MYNSTMNRIHTAIEAVVPAEAEHLLVAIVRDLAAFCPTQRA